MNREKIEKKIKEMEKGMGKVKTTDSYQKIIRSLFNQWKNHHQVSMKSNKTKERLNKLLIKHRETKKQLTEKSLQIQQIKNDFGLVYDKKDGKYKEVEDDGRRI